MRPWGRTVGKRILSSRLPVTQSATRRIGRESHDTVDPSPGTVRQHTAAVRPPHGQPDPYRHRPQCPRPPRRTWLCRGTGSRVRRTSRDGIRTDALGPGNRGRRVTRDPPPRRPDQTALRPTSRSRWRPWSPGGQPVGSCSTCPAPRLALSVDGAPAAVRLMPHPGVVARLIPARSPPAPRRPNGAGYVNGLVPHRSGRRSVADVIVPPS